MTLVVTDTNVFIDLMDVGALAPFFALGFEVHTTGFVVNELDTDQRTELLPFIGNGRLIVARFTEEQVQAIGDLPTKLKIQFTDRSVVYLALAVKGMILSGDSGLWKEGQSRQLEVHGSLWVMEQVWQRNLLPPVTCIQCLENMGRLNSRLPKDKLDALIERIRKG